MEDFVFGGCKTYAEGWTKVNERAFNQKEIDAVRSNSVVSSNYGKSVVFMLVSGGQCYIPLSKNSDLALGSAIDMHNAKLITLERPGDGQITRVEI